MSEGSTTAIVRSKPRSPWLLKTAALCLLAAVVAVGVAAVPFLFDGATLLSDVSAQVRATTGLVIEAKGRARFVFLPDPHVSLGGLHVRDPSGTLTIDADTLQGEVRLLPLLVGRLELSSATLIRPHLTIDLDGGALPPSSMIGRALHADAAVSGPTLQANAGDRLGSVTLVDGTATLRGGGVAHPFLFGDVNVTLAWPDLQSSATLTGTLTVADTKAELATWIAQPSSLMRGDHSAVTLNLHSPPLDLSATGDLVDATTASFRGRVIARAPSLPAALALVGADITSPAPLAHLTLNSDARIDADHGGVISLDLPKLDLHVDGNRYEGTLAFLNGADPGTGKPSLSGTLATEDLTVAPFLSMAPRLTDADRRWTRAPVSLRQATSVRLDLRVSATHLHLTPVTVDDAALAVISRDDRLEIALIEGSAYGGAVKARVSYGVTDGELSLRGAGSFSGADAAALSWDTFGRQIATGSLSGSANIESAGDSPAALMGHLQGWAKGKASEGELSGVDVGLGLRALAQGQAAAVMPALRAGRTPFQTFDVSLRLADGIATVGEATMKGPDATLSISGDANIGSRTLDLHAIAATPADVAPGPRVRLPFDVTGSLNKIVFSPVIGGASAPDQTR